VVELDDAPPAVGGPAAPSVDWIAAGVAVAAAPPDGVPTGPETGAPGKAGGDAEDWAADWLEDGAPPCPATWPASAGRSTLDDAAVVVAAGGWAAALR